MFRRKNPQLSARLGLPLIPRAYIAAVIQELEQRTFLSAAVSGSTLTPQDSVPPAFTGTTSGSLTIGQTGSLAIDANGSPTPTLTELGALPSGVTFTDNGNGTGELSGAAAAGTAGVYDLLFAARNGAVPSASGNFTLTVVQAPAIVSAASVTFQTGILNQFTVATTGTATASLTESGNLPAGITFTDNGDGTGLLSGLAAATAGGNYDITFTATSSISPPATQAFVLSVNAPLGSAPGVGAVKLVGTAGPDVVSLTVSGSNVIADINGSSESLPVSTTGAINLFTGAGADSVTIGVGVPPCYVNGGGGNDTIIANNTSNDVLFGGAGNDSIVCGSGNYSVDGGTKNDTLVAGSGNDTLTGDGGNDSIVGGSGADIMQGGAGNDTIISGSGPNSLHGSGGNDSLDGSGGGSDFIAGGAGIDTILGAINGDTGIDTIVGTTLDTITPGPADSVTT